MSRPWDDPRRLLLPLLFPQEAACHLCERATEGEGRILCPACEAALRALRIPAQDALSLHEPLSACISAYFHDGEARRLSHLLKFRWDAAAARPPEALLSLHERADHMSVRITRYAP